MSLKTSRLKSSKQLLKEIQNPPEAIKFVSPYIGEYLSKLPEEYLNLDESSLLEKIRSDVGNPAWQPKLITETLRKRFFDELAIAQQYGVQVSETKLYTGVCSKGQFQQILLDPHQLAFFCCKPQEYTDTIEALLARGNRRLEEFLALPVKNKMGEVDVKLVDAIFKAVLYLDQRRHGGIIQKSEQIIRQSVEHTSANSKEVKAQVVDIDQRIMELEKKLLESKQLLPAPEKNGEKETSN